MDTLKRNMTNKEDQLQEADSKYYAQHLIKNNYKVNRIY